MVTKPKSKPAGIDYSGLAFPKGETRKAAKNRKDRIGKRTRRDVKAIVFDRDVTCRAYGVSPVCTRQPWDRHELKPVGRGGKITTRNCVAVCRRCHDACQNALGGLPLAFVWDGKDRGVPPDADRPGAVWAVWRNIWRGVRKEQDDGR